MLAPLEPKVTPWHIKEQDFPHTESLAERIRFLLGYAVLAPSSHNTQPWKFLVGEDSVMVFVDKTRWLQVADHDQRELYLSVGCALENLLIAARYFGLEYQVVYFPEPSDTNLVATITFNPQHSQLFTEDVALFTAIHARHTNHAVYANQSIEAQALQHLQTCCMKEGIELVLTDDPAIKREVDRLVVRADALQFSDPAWRAELGYWIGQGAFGTPWLLAKLTQFAVTYLDMGNSTAKKDSEVLMSAPLLGVIASQGNDRTTQVQAGQVFERVCLLATSLGIRIQPMNQVLQLPAIKEEVARLLPVQGTTPQITFRLGYAPAEQQHTPRRPLADVLLPFRAT